MARKKREGKDLEGYSKISSPRIFLFRMMVFLVLAGLLAALLYRPIYSAFLANPLLNGVIFGVLFIGIILAFRQVLRLFPEVDWVNGFRLADPGIGGRSCARLARADGDLAARPHGTDGDLADHYARHSGIDRDQAR